MNNKYIRALEECYMRKGILHQPLCTTCSNCNACWHGARHRALSNQKDEYGLIHTHVYKPWIGSYYERNRILVIAQNMNNYGGYEAQVNLISAGRIELEMGRKKLFISPTYSGTLLYHRVGAYLISILQKDGSVFQPFINGLPIGKDLAAVYDNVAMTNIIKCSLIGDRSKPTPAMWEKCGQHILLDEINILRPNRLLIIGKEVLKALNSSVFDTPLNIDYSNSVISGTASVNSVAIKFTNVIHPASYGGSSMKIIKDVYKLS